jgi:hypothetical protein
VSNPPSLPFLRVTTKATWWHKSFQVKNCNASEPAGVSAIGIGVALRDHRTPSASFDSTRIRSTNPTSTDCSIQVQQFGGGVFSGYSNKLTHQY